MSRDPDFGYAGAGGSSRRLRVALVLLRDVGFPALVAAFVLWRLDVSVRLLVIEQARQTEILRQIETQLNAARREAAPVHREAGFLVCGAVSAPSPVSRGKTAAVGGAGAIFAGGLGLGEGVCCGRRRRMCCVAGGRVRGVSTLRGGGGGVVLAWRGR